MTTNPRRWLGIVLLMLLAAPASVSAAPSAGAVAPRAVDGSVTAPGSLHVPHVAGRVHVNAETEGKAYWGEDRGVTPNFTDEQKRGMVPFTQAKARWGRGFLYLLLYAGDLDLQGHVKKRDGAVENDDAFRLTFGRGDDVRIISVSVLGAVADTLCAPSPSGRRCDSSWDSRAVVAVDRDGSLNEPGGNDEEWVVEMAIPLLRLGIKHPGAGTHILLAIQRCEVGQDGRHACGSWGLDPLGDLILDP